MSIILPRRGFLLGLGALLFAPAIVRAENIMPVRAIVQPYSDQWWKVIGTDGSEEFLSAISFRNQHLVGQQQLVDKIMNAQQVWLQ